MVAIAHGPVSWRLARDDNGFRTYSVEYDVEASVSDGPYTIMHAVGLPTVGSPLSILGFSGVDPWVWCRPEIRVDIKRGQAQGPVRWYTVECVFSNHYMENRSYRCNSTEILSPLLEPQRVRSGMNKVPFEAKYDRHGHRLVTSANEPLTGQNVTFDYGRPTVHIEQNVGDLQLPLISSMFNTVNDSPLWGVPARCVKLSSVSWERRVMMACTYFYTRIFDFEIDMYMRDKDGNQIGFDRELWDHGSMCLRGHWITDTESPYYKAYLLLSDTIRTVPDPIKEDPDDQDPELPEGSCYLKDIDQGDLIAYKDMSYENTRAFLDGHGRPANTQIIAQFGEINEQSGPAANWVVEFYDESNFLLLGIPTSF